MSVDPNWCYENPEEAARQIDLLQSQQAKAVDLHEDDDIQESSEDALKDALEALSMGLSGFHDTVELVNVLKGLSREHAGEAGPLPYYLAEAAVHIYEQRLALFEAKQVIENQLAYMEAPA